MIRHKMDLSDEKRAAIIEASLCSKNNIRKRKIVAPISFIIGIFEIIMGVYFCSKGVSFFSLIILVFGIFMILLSINTKSFQRYILEKSERYIDRYFRYGVIEYIFDEDGIQVISEFGESKNYWGAFKEYALIGQYFFIKRNDNNMIFVDKNELTKEEVEELKKLLLNIG